MTDHETTPARFARGSGVTSRPYNPRQVGNIQDLRASLRAYNLRGLEWTLYVILAVCAVLWLADGASFVGTLYYGAGVHPGVGLALFLVVSLFQRHLLGFKGVVEELFGRGARVAMYAGLIIGAVVVLVGAANIGSSALGGLYILHQQGYTYLGWRPAALAFLSGAVVSHAEVIGVLAWLALGWVRKNR